MDKKTLIKIRTMLKANISLSKVAAETAVPRSTVQYIAEQFKKGLTPTVQAGGSVCWSAPLSAAPPALVLRAVAAAAKIGVRPAARDFEVSSGTLSGWLRESKKGKTPMLVNDRLRWLSPADVAAQEAAKEGTLEANIFKLEQDYIRNEAEITRRIELRDRITRELEQLKALRSLRT